MAKEQSNNVFWKRLSVVMQFAGMSTVNAFALSIGLKRPEGLYQIKSGKLRISRKLAENIHKTYPMFSVFWLLYGDSFFDKKFDDMAEINGIERIPFYEDLLNNDIVHIEPSRHIYLPKSVSFGAQLATTYYDDLFSESLSCGAHLLLKKHVGEIIFGNIYLIEMKKAKLLRILKSVPENRELLRLTTSRSAVYDDMIVERKSVKPLYVVCGAITNFCL